MKTLVTILFIAPIAIISGCASIKGSISNAHKSDITATVESSSIKKADSLKSENASLKTQLDQEKQLNEQKDVQLKTIEENADYTIAGGTSSEGAKGDGASSISQMVVRGRITAISTYFYKNDSISTRLIVGDTVINIHRKVTISDDKSKIQSESDVHANSQSSVSNSSSVATESKTTASSSRDKKTADTVKLSFGASIGISNWWPVIIALILGLSIGIGLGRKSKK